MLAIPAGLAWQLLGKGTLAVRNSDPYFKALFGFAYNRYEANLYWWHLLILVRQFWIVSISTFSSYLQMPTRTTVFMRARMHADMCM